MTTTLALILNIVLGVGILTLLFKAMRLPFRLRDPSAAPIPRARRAPAHAVPRPVERPAHARARARRGYRDPATVEG